MESPRNFDGSPFFPREMGLSLPRQGLAKKLKALVVTDASSSALTYLQFVLQVKRGRARLFVVNFRELPAKFVDFYIHVARKLAKADLKNLLFLALERPFKVVLKHKSNSEKTILGLLKITETSGPKFGKFCAKVTIYR